MVSILGLALRRLIVPFPPQPSILRLTTGNINPRTKSREYSGHEQPIPTTSIISNHEVDRTILLGLGGMHLSADFPRQPHSLRTSSAEE